MRGTAAPSTYLPKANGAAIRTCRSQNQQQISAPETLAAEYREPAKLNPFSCDAIRMLALRQSNLFCHRASMQPENPAT